MAGPESIDLSGAKWSGPNAQKGARDAAALTGDYLSNQRTAQDIRKGEATSQYEGPKAQAELKDKQLKTLLDMSQNARDELKTFEGLEEVKTYRQGMRYFTAALSVPLGAEGDQDLITLAAKVQDPTGAVMQGDIERYNNVQVAKDYLPQWALNQWNNAGTFTPETRKRIIAFLRNRIDTYRLPYQDMRGAFEARTAGLNEQLVPLGIKPIVADQILGSDPLKLYGPKIDAYDRQVEVDRIRAEREAGGPSADILAGVPEGAQIAGQDIQGWRFSPETEVDLNAISTSPTGTAEAFAKLLADRAVSEGHVPPSQRDDYYQRALLDNQDFFKQKPEQRATPIAIDYREVDKAASENAGLLDTVAQSVRNSPESAVQILEGATALPKDVVLSTLTGERMGSVKSFTDLAAELGQGQFDGPTVTAMAEAMKERYGSLDAIKRTLIKDPLGLAADMSIFVTGGGSALARAPGAIGKFGEGLATAGKLMDPLSAGMGLVTEGLPSLYNTAKNRAPGFTDGVENLPSNIAGFPSNTGGAAIREATGAGFERGVAGAPTPRSEAFTQGMRSPGESAENIVYTARDALRGLREAASTAYSTAMKKFGQNPVPLSIDVVRQRMAGIKPRNYDAMLTAPKRPSDHLAWEQMNDTVEHYAQQAAKDPSLLEPMAMDQFKQDVYNIGSKIGGAFDRDAANIAKTAYNAIRQELVKHDPVYADIMRDYEKVAVEARELEDTFSLGQARGKPLKVDTAARKLQSIMRNNAFTNYGMRVKQGERLAELDATGTLMPATSGQMLSAPFARGITGGVAAGGLPLTAAGGIINPMTLLATVPILGATSPRLAGELAYGVGRVAGTGKRAFDAITGSPIGKRIADTGSDLASLYNKYPQLFLAEAQLGTKLQETEQERLERMYADAMPSIPANASYEDYIPPQLAAPAPAAPPMAMPTPAAQAEVAPAAPTKTRIIYEGREVEYDPVTDTYVELATGRRVRELPELKQPAQAMYRGGLMALAQRYR